MKTTLVIAAAVLAAVACAQNTQEVPSQEITIETVDYAVKGADTLKMDVYVREDLRSAEKLPVMFYVHGGGFSMGSRKNVAQEIFIRHFVEEGYLGVSIDYRLAGGEGFKYGCESVLDVIKLACEDMADATRYLLEHYNADPEKIITSGGSAGAVMVLQIEYDICNEASYLAGRLPEGFNYAGVISAAGGISTPLDEKELTWKHDPCPVLLMYGSEDMTVNEVLAPYMGMNMFCSKTLHEEFDKWGYPNWLYTEIGADHVVAMKHLTANQEEADEFIRHFVNEGKKSSVTTEWKDAEPAGMADIDAMVKNVPMYILGYEKYLSEMDWNNLGTADEIKY